MCPGEAWQPGAIITYQEVYRGKLWSARPVRVVRDDTDVLALWCPEGTPVKGPCAPSRAGREAGAEYFRAMFSAMDWQFSDFVWPLPSNLMLLHPGEWYAVWVSWTSAGEPLGWYINFQRPLVRTPTGIQTVDLALDLVVDLDLSYRWKDEDEFEALLADGLIDQEEANRIRVAAAEVLKRIATGDEPFTYAWRQWAPNGTWGVPELPTEWWVV